MLNFRIGEMKEGTPEGVTPSEEPGGASEDFNSCNIISKTFIKPFSYFTLVSSAEKDGLADMVGTLWQFVSAPITNLNQPALDINIEIWVAFRHLFDFRKKPSKAQKDESADPVDTVEAELKEVANIELAVNERAS